MYKLERNLNRIGVVIGIGMIIMIVMAMSSCSTGYEVSNCPGLAMKKCCEKTANEVYKYEGEYINENK